MALDICFDIKTFLERTCRTCSRYFNDEMVFFGIFRVKLKDSCSLEEDDEVEYDISDDVKEIFDDLNIWKLNISSLLYILVITGKDPCVNVESGWYVQNASAVASVVVAACFMGVSIYTGSPVYHAVGSLLVGSLLGVVASLIIYTNVFALVGNYWNAFVF
uniref:Uncharacterized protein n=1 Tax=Glossina palpalis gambiensis TaxID=67801 RepID=A0A1B0C351_9MUSC